MQGSTHPIHVPYSLLTQVRPWTAPYNITFEGTTEKGKSLSSPATSLAISAHFQDWRGRRGKGRVAHMGAHPRSSSSVPARSSHPDLDRCRGPPLTGGAEAWSCVLLSRHCSLLKVEFCLVVTSWIGCLMADKAPFVASGTKGRGKAEFLMWPINFQLVLINLFLDLSKTKLC